MFPKLINLSNCRGRSHEARSRARGGGGLERNTERLLRRALQRARRQHRACDTPGTTSALHAALKKTFTKLLVVRPELRTRNIIITHKSVMMFLL